MAVTIKDIAKKTGVTVAAVSKALNDKPDIGDQLKARVRKVAKEMGYKRNMLARRLVTRKSNTIGVFLFSRETIGNASESSAFKYIVTLMEETVKQGYDIVLFTHDSDLKDSKSYIDLCLERQVEGVIFIGLDERDPHLQEIINSPIPVVIAEKKLSGKNVSCINSNNRKGVQLAINYLLEQGHKRISFVSGFHDVAASIERYRTVKRILKKNDLFFPELMFEGNFTMESGYVVGKKIALLDPLPSAVFAASDLMAIGVMRALLEEKISIPGKIAVMGYDNFEIGKYYTPRLSTVAQNFKTMAEEGISTLFRMIKGEEGAVNLLIEPELILRESTNIVIKG